MKKPINYIFRTKISPYKSNRKIDGTKYSYTYGQLHINSSILAPYINRKCIIIVEVL